MKQILALVAFTTIFQLSFAQTGQNSIQHNKAYYLQKSKKQKTACISIGTTGLTLLIVGIGIALNEFGKPLHPNQKKNMNTGEALTYIGGGLTLASIPLAFAYKKNKKIAASIVFKNTPYPNLAKGKNGTIYFPSLTFHFALSK